MPLCICNDFSLCCGCRLIRFLFSPNIVVDLTGHRIIHIRMLLFPAIQMMQSIRSGTDSLRL